MSNKLIIGNIIVYGLCSVIWLFNGFNRLGAIENVCDSHKVIFMFIMAVFYGIVSLLNLYALKKY